MLMKGARQSSSLPEVGRRLGEEERAAAGIKRGMGQARLGEGRGEPNGGLLGFPLPPYQPCIPSWCSCEEPDAVTCWVTSAASSAEVLRELGTTLRKMRMPATALQGMFMASEKVQAKLWRAQR